MERLIEQGRLLDAYGALLTDRQRGITAQYVYENCTLSEIAEREGISRQGVHDTLARAMQQLCELECALGLVRRLDEQQRRARSLYETLDALPLKKQARDALKDELNELLAVWEDEDGV